MFRSDPHRSVWRSDSGGEATPISKPSEGEQDDARRSTGGFSRLAASAAAPQEDCESEADFDLPSEEPVSNRDPQDERLTGPRTPREALVAAAMISALTPAAKDALRCASAQAVVVSAPSADWIAPLKRFFEERPFGRKWSCVARDGSDRRFHKPSAGNGEVASDLAAGRSVVGIAVAPDQVLPSTLIAAADIRIALRFEPEIVEEAIRRVYGGSTSRIDKRDLVGLDLDDVVAAMRPGGGERDVTARLSAAVKTRAGQFGADDVPALDTAVEYGAAREWGLALARDMRDYRAGDLPWSGVDRGAVFHSGPGMGKSVLARSIARACEATLVAGSIGELFATSSGHLDGVIKAMRELFAKAVAAAPSILFLDEIDGLPSRDSLDSRNRDWWMPVIEDFMLLLDDATSARREGVVVIGATNRIAAVDPAILRPGRLERAIELFAPDAEGILNILRFHVRGSLPEQELRSIAGLLEGFTPAEITEAVRNARRMARGAGRDLSVDDVKGAALPVPTVPPAALKRIAIHEAGHVVVALACGLGTVKLVRIGGRHGAGGVTSIDLDPSDLVTRQSIERQVVGLLAGRAAEIVLLGAPSAGSGGSDRSDLALATQMLASMDLSYGLGENGLIYVGDAEKAVNELRHNAVARARVDEMLRRLQARATEIVDRHRRQVVDIADALIERRFLSREEIELILAGMPVSDEPAPSAARAGGSP